MTRSTRHVVPFAALPFVFRNVQDVPCQGGGFLGSAFDPLRIEGDPAARRELLEKAETILVRDAPIIPIYDYVRRYLVAPGVQGWVTSGRGPTPSRFLSVRPAPP